MRDAMISIVGLGKVTRERKKRNKELERYINRNKECCFGMRKGVFFFFKSYKLGGSYLRIRVCLAYDPGRCPAVPLRPVIHFHFPRAVGHFFLCLYTRSVLSPPVRAYKNALGYRPDAFAAVRPLLMHTYNTHWWKRMRLKCIRAVIESNRAAAAAAK